MATIAESHVAGAEAKFVALIRIQEPACAPLVDQARYWMVPGDPRDIAAFLRAHAPPGIPNRGEGQLSTAGQTIS